MAWLQNKIGDIAQEQKEQALAAKAAELGFGYINFENTSIKLESLSIIPEEIAKDLSIICFFSVQKKIRIAVVNESDIRVKNYIAKLKSEGYSVNINLCTIESLGTALAYFDKTRETKIEKKISLSVDNTENTDTKQKKTDSEFKWHDLLNNVYVEALKGRASDIHFEAWEENALVRLRIDWILQDLKQIEPWLYDDVVRIIKHNSNLILNIKNKAQDWQFFIEVDNRKIDFRVSVLPTKHWESVVMRILDSSKNNIDLSSLWFLPIQIDILEKAIQKTDWMTLVTGPTWSWKTSTLYSILNKLKSKDKKLITLEDPIEYAVSDIVQSQIDEHFTFTEGLKACLRHDPDIIMLWEIRNQEAARTAMQASITGHQVLSTVHTNNAVEAFFRLLDLDIEPYLIASSVNLIIAQRLIRRNCPKCVKKRPIKKEHIAYIESLDLWLDLKEIKEESYSTWCENCSKSWFVWREAIAEFLPMDETIKEMILKGSPVIDFEKYIKKQWFIHIQASAIVKAIKWVTTFAEAFKVNI